MENYAYVTAITNKRYLGGVKTLVKSLRRTGTTIPLRIMMPKKCCDSDLHREVAKLNLEIIFLPDIELDSEYCENNRMAHWNNTFFKLNVAQLVQFTKIIFLDADMIILKNIDHLFAYPSISATTGGKSAHPEWEEFNSGIMVLEPSHELFQSLVECIVPAIERKTALKLGYGDQDVFNQYYPDWKNDPQHNFGECYNVEHCFVDDYVKVTGSNRFDEIYVLHFIGENKIWNKSFIQLIQMFHGLTHDKKYHEWKACLLYLKYLYL